MNLVGSIILNFQRYRYKPPGISIISFRRIFTFTVKLKQT